ncbi:MAG: hypothetical protein J0H08_03915 [Rhizobiales bacterium]|nr:hypothetical protein [Hyphomicrobiales bacterium]
MTIAMGFLTPEGFVVGADSTTTFTTDDGNHYYNHAQKIFEVGQNSSLTIATWGLGSLHTVSYRHLIADLGDLFQRSAPASVEDAAKAWADLFWEAYSEGPRKPSIVRCQELHAKPAHEPAAPNATSRTADEELEYASLKQNLVVGFCIGGNVASDRTPRAHSMIFDPLSAAPVPQPVPLGAPQFWGVPNVIGRLLIGCDARIPKAILDSGKWSGTEKELLELLIAHRLQHQTTMPIREAIDFTYSCIHATIKALKFSNLSQICGGPIEVAVITADRGFRWVRHKELYSAISEV